jgi:uncharacterized membrane protein
MNQKTQFIKTVGVREMTPEIKSDILAEDFMLKDILASKLRQNATWKNIKRAIQNYIGAEFTGVEGDVLKFVVTELKGMYRKYGVLDVRGAHGIYVISYPVYVKQYTAFNKVTYRIVVLLKEYGRGYIVLNRHSITVDTNAPVTEFHNKYYDYYELANLISSTLDLILSYDYELVSKEAYIDFRELKGDGHIRVQGDLLLHYVKYPEETLHKIIKGSIESVLAELFVQDAVRYISKRLNEYRIEHTVDHNRNRSLIEILVSKGEGAYVNRLQWALEKILERELNLSREDYDIRTAYRCYYGLNMCGYIISLNIYRSNIVKRVGSLDLVEELAEGVMVPRRHVLNIGNHVAEFVAYDNMVYIDLNMPFTGDTIRQYMRYSTLEYYIEPGVYEVSVRHSEHGINRLRVESDMGLAINWWTVEKPRVHDIIRNKIALRRLVSKYA